MPRSGLGSRKGLGLAGCSQASPVGGGGGGRGPPGLVVSRPPPAGRVTSRRVACWSRDVRALASSPLRAGTDSRAAAVRCSVVAGGGGLLSRGGGGALGDAAGMGHADAAGRRQGQPGRLRL